MYIENLDNPDIRIKFCRINIITMDEIFVYFFNVKPDTDHIISNIGNKPNTMSKASQIMYKWLFPNRIFQKMRYYVERTRSEPLDINTNDLTYNGLLYESAEPITKLYNMFINLDKTHILQEYFIPPSNFEPWMLFLKQFWSTYNTRSVSLLNITIRYVEADTTSYLSYAKTSVYAFVFYYRIDISPQSDTQLKDIHHILTDKALSLNGSFYLPYRHHYSQTQLTTSYPEIYDFLNLKTLYDKDNIFTNLWYDEISYYHE